MDYGLNENEWDYDKSRGDVYWWCNDGTWNERTEDISGVAHLTLSALH